MGRISDYQASAKAITGGVAQTVTFTPSDLEGAGAVAYHLAMTGTNNLSFIDRIRVKANGLPFIDLSMTLFRAYIQRFTEGRVHYPITSAQPPPPSAAGAAANWKRFTIPLCFLDRQKSEEADVCQFPVGALPTIEIVFNASAGAGSLFAGWTLSDVTPLCYPKLYSSQMNIAASVVNGRYPFSEDGVIRGFGIETTGLARFRSVINGRQVYHMQGQPADSATVTEDMLFLESEHLFGGAVYSSAGTVTNLLDTTIVDPAWIKITSGDEGAPGNTFAEVQTTAAWSGVTSELGIFAVVPYQQQEAA